jgi:hypothetical protein
VTEGWTTDRDSNWFRLNEGITKEIPMKRVVFPVLCLTVFAWAGFAQAETIKLEIKGAY